MNAYVGITDWEWFQLLRQQVQPAEANFWKPGGNQVFRALTPGELFLFKLHSPRNYIVGGGVFAHSSLLPVSLAWKSFRSEERRVGKECRSRVALDHQKRT